MSENVSRRKMLSMLGLGATLGFTLSGMLEPLEAEAQEATPATRRTRRHRDPPDATTGRTAHPSRTRTRHQRRHTRAPRSPCCTRCNSSSAIAIRAGRTTQKGRGKLMLSSSVSVQCSRNKSCCYLLQESPRSARGCEFAAAVERLVLTLAGQTTKVPLDAKSGGAFSLQPEFFGGSSRIISASRKRDESLTFS